MARVWGIAPDEIPQAGLSAQSRSWKRSIAARSKALLSICFNPLVSLPDANFTREALEKLEFFGVIDFFLSETAQHADVVLAGSLQEEEEGVSCNVEGRVIHIQQGRRPAGQRARRFRRSSATWRAGWAAASTSRSASRARSSTSCARRRAAASPTTTASPTRRSTSRWASSGRARRADHPGTPRLFEGGRFFHPDGKARFHGARSGARAAIRWTTSIPIYLTTGRVVSQYLSGTQTRRIGALVDQYPEPRVEIHPRLAEQHGIADGDWVTVTTRRSDDHAAGAWSCARSGPTRSSFRTTGRAGASANRLTHRTLDPRSKIPEFKVSACRIAEAQPDSPEGAR